MKLEPESVGWKCSIKIHYQQNNYSNAAPGTASYSPNGTASSQLFTVTHSTVAAHAADVAHRGARNTRRQSITGTITVHASAVPRDATSTTSTAAPMLRHHAAATAGVSVLMWVGVDHLSSCRSGWIDSKLRPTNVNGVKYGSCYIDGVPQPEIIAKTEAWVFDAVKRLRNHPALGGYYGCDDCCHTVRGTFCVRVADFLLILGILDIGVLGV